MQDIFAISIVAVAAGYLARQTWLRLASQRGGSCGACSNCSSNDSLKSRPLVNISLDAIRK
jgi:FeoB-associated Cys-rich membrane protein